MFRIGSGIDFHEFAKTPPVNGHIKIGGVGVAHKFALIGHSDADVVLHALVDALLGAIGAGDIGEHFPPSDNKWKGADSEIFVKHAMSLLQNKGASIGNADITIIAEYPKISPYKPQIKSNVARLLGVDGQRVGIKATTTEGMGFIGRGEGLGAMASVLVLI